MAGWPGAIAALVLFSGCAAIQPASTSAGSAVESISFELKSWGFPVEGFTIDSDGRGEFRKAPEFRADVRITRFSAGRAGFERIRAVLAPVERYREQAAPCGQRMTDFPYGEIVWQTGGNRAAVRLDVGCRSAEMQRVVTQAHEATRLAEGFARSNPAP